MKKLIILLLTLVYIDIVVCIETYRDVYTYSHHSERTTQANLGQNNTLAFLFYTFDQDHSSVNYTIGNLERNCSSLILKAKGNNVLRWPISFQVINEYRVVLFYLEKDSSLQVHKKEFSLIKKVTVIDLHNCKTFEIELPASSRYKFLDDHQVNPEVIFYRDNFDVFFKNSLYCGDQVCKLTYDYHGKIVGSIAPFIAHVPKIIPVEYLSPAKGHLVFKKKSNKFTIYLARKHDLKILREIDPIDSFHEVSTTHNTIGIFSRLNSTGISVSQYDLFGNIILETSLNLKYEVQSVTLLNLATGGFLLMTSSCETSYCHNHGVYELTKVDAMGKPVGSSIILANEYKEAIIGDMTLYERGVGTYCLSWLFIEPKESFSTILAVFTKCFRDRDFRRLHQALMT